MAENYSIFLILSDIRSVHNVGSIFRTADAVGVTKIFLVGQIASPIDRFGRARPDLAKVSLGAEKTVPWEYHETIAPLIKNLKNQKIEIVALEQSPKSIDYRKLRPKVKLALILGNEVSGLPKKVLKLADKVIEIPMRGKKESLNVSVSAGVALFRISDFFKRV